MIRCTDIHKQFGTLEVLRGIDLEIPAGQVATIVGPSGAGKTTLLQILGTLSRPDRGSVEIAGQETGSLRGAELVRLRNEKIGFVFQFHHLLPEFTALENVMIPALIAHRSRSAAAERAAMLLELLGVGDRADHKPAAMSGGEQQRVAVARALMNEPSVIFADEPSGNLDSANRETLHRLFFDLRDRFGYTFVIVTHDNELAAMSDRRITMRDGLLVTE
ncbi:MAG TPA: ABC transporter ATP-binding protein [Candidatus Rikenella faecigallinarum]|uniref:ABC transporter ATP-binding protein n=1 Tax=Candidatus Rikenella faecigallinarum TaxID=2838745 RepID=A0A9D1QDB8_9BACT|nr:ABC transporter ATP-binding protein [Candidatus Rikenella faecigallinarum]